MSQGEETLSCSIIYGRLKTSSDAKAFRLEYHLQIEEMNAPNYMVEYANEITTFSTRTYTAIVSQLWFEV